MITLLDPLLKEYASKLTPEHEQEIMEMLKHLDEKSRCTKIKIRFLEQLLMAMDDENVQAFIEANGRHPSNLDELFVFWEEQGYTIYFAILEWSIQNNHEAPTFEQFNDMMLDPRHHP
ncbi:MAG: hypothetical protein WCV55_03660 [Candidatus Paceibacterota bacterium]